MNLIFIAIYIGHMLTIATVAWILNANVFDVVAIAALYLALKNKYRGMND